MKFLVLVPLTLLVYHVQSQSPPCSRIESVDISLGSNYDNNSIIYNSVEYGSNAWYTIVEDGETVVLGCPCIGRVCVWKCCGVGQAMFGRDCNETDLTEVNPFSPPVYKGKEQINVEAHRRFFYMYNRLCLERYLVDPNDPVNEIYVQENGSLIEITRGVLTLHKPTSYCVDQVSRGNDAPRLMAAICFPSEDDLPNNEDGPALDIAYAIGLYLSTPFLIATCLVYACIAELRNLHGLSLVAYCAGLIVAYPLLAYLKLSAGISMTGCYVIAFLVYFAFQTSFFWLNIMCFDIWKTFSGYRGGSRRGRSELRRFLLYGVYAWGCPILLTVVTISMQFSDGLSQNIIRPDFGTKRCWFPEWISEALYFWLPVLLLVIINIVLFSVTAYRIRAIKQETAILKGSESARSDRLKRDKQRYVLYLKLFVVMGVNWAVELLGFVVGGSNWYWAVIDLSNIMLGVFIFLIFVWKNKVRGLVIKKWRQMRGAPAVVDSVRSTTLPTEETRISQDDNAIRMKDMH